MKIRKLFIILVIIIALFLIGFGLFKFVVTKSYKSSDITGPEEKPYVVDKNNPPHAGNAPAPPKMPAPPRMPPPRLPASGGNEPQFITEGLPAPPALSPRPSSTPSPPKEKVKHHSKILPDEDPNIQRAEEMLQKNNLAEAEKLIRALIEKEPGKARIILLQGELLQKKGEFREAYNKYKNSIKLDPENSLAIARMAEVCQLLDKPGEGIKYMDMTGDLHAFSAFENIFKIDLYLQRAAGRKMKGDSEWKKDVESAEKIFEKLKKFDRPEVPIVKGKIEFLKGNREKALQNFIKAVSNPSLNPTYKVDILTAIARIHIDGGNPDKALPYLNAITAAAGKWKPDSFDTCMTYPEYALVLKHKMLGKSLDRDKLKARKLFYETLRKKGIQIEGYNPEKEIELLSDIMFPPADSTPEKKLKNARRYLSEYSEGKNLPRYFSEKVFHSTNRKMLGYVFIGEALEEKGDFKESAESFKKALTFSPRNHMIKKKLAKLRKAVGGRRSEVRGQICRRDVLIPINGERRTEVGGQRSDL